MRSSDPRVRIVFVHRHRSNLNSIFTLQATGCNFRYGPNFGVPFWSNLSVQIFLHLLAKCTRDRPLHLWSVKILQSLSSWNTVRFQQHSGILHPYKICSICLVVITFHFVLRIFAIEDLCEHDHHDSKARLSWSRLARTRNSTLLPQRVSQYHERIHILHTFLRLLRKEWADFTEVSVRKTVVIVSKSAQWWIDNFPPPLLLSWPLDNRLVAQKTGCPLSASVTIIFSAILSHSPCGQSSLIDYHFFSEPWPLSCSKSSCKYRNESSIWLAFYLVVFWSAWDAVEHRHE